MDTGVVENNKESYIGNLVLPIAILGLSAICFIQSLGFPTNEDVGPAAVPFLWIGFTVVFCTALIIQAVLRRGKPDPVSGKISFVFLFVGWLIVYLGAIELIGYFLSTFIFLVGSMYVLTYRKHVIIFSVSIGWLIFSYIIFAKFLYIPLPIGPILKPILS